MDFGLNHLDFMLGVDVMLPDDRRTCALILAELKQIYDSALQGQGTCSVASILCFPKQDSGKFARLIKRRVPQALIILAYYCVLLDILDSKWWIHGWSTRVLRDVLSSLDEQWRHWIEWYVRPMRKTKWQFETQANAQIHSFRPVQSVLTKSQPPPADVNMAEFMV